MVSVAAETQEHAVELVVIVWPGTCRCGRLALKYREEANQETLVRNRVQRVELDPLRSHLFEAGETVQRGRLHLRWSSCSLRSPALS